MTMISRARAALLGAAGQGYTSLFRMLERRGFYLLRKHYYLPIPDRRELEYASPTEMVGVDIDPLVALSLLDSVILPRKAEFAAFPVEGPTPAHRFFLLNGVFMAIDGNVYHALVRHLRPVRIIEVGAGYSTLLASAAAAANVAEGARRTEIVCIEPYPSDTLTSLGDAVTVIREPVQRVPMDLFLSLGPGDILFIDSTHVLKSGGDVWYEYCEILPRLRSGVYVHVHDVSLPLPYPRTYFDQRLYWNEQYLLQAFLTYNSRVEVIWPGNYLMCTQRNRMAAAFSPEYEAMRGRFPSSEPTSFWFRVR
jgi:hypothetical protein